MLVGYSFGWFLIIITSILSAVLAGWIAHIKFKIDGKYWISPATGFCIGFILSSRSLCVLEVHNESRIEKYMVFGRAEFKAADDQVVNVSWENGDGVFIVNCTDEPMELETIRYGESYSPLSFDFPPTVIDPHTAYSVFSIPDYFPTQRPPHEVWVRKSQRGETKYWLRFAN
jgi:hypothetical protein